VHDPYLGATTQQKLLDTAYTAARLVGTIVVPKGNPKAIKTLADLTRPGLRLVFTDSTYSTLGHLLPVMARRSDLGAKLFANVVTRTKSSGEAANAVSLGTADAAIVWDAVAFLRSDKLDAIPIQPSAMPVAGVDAVTSATFGSFDMSNVKVTVIVLSCSKVRPDARAFAAYCASAQNASVWRDLGYSPVLTQAAPALGGSVLVYCAAGMRLPVERIANEFGKATGAKMELTYDGSNKLLGQIELTKKGDVYITGDADYIDMARQKGLIAREKDICLFVPVIMVQKGNPKAVTSLADLTKKGVKIGQGDEKAAAVGRIMLKLLAENRVDTALWRKNVVLVTPTVNELANAIKLGTIDAAVVWNAIAASYPKDASVVSIDSARNIFPHVGGAVLTCSKNQPAAVAFLDFATSPWARFVLKENGYTVP
jgi:molybdate transport system substrate-binding protein